MPLADIGRPHSSSTRSPAGPTGVDAVHRQIGVVGVASPEARRRVTEPGLRDRVQVVIAYATELVTGGGHGTAQVRPADLAPTLGVRRCPGQNLGDERSRGCVRVGRCRLAASAAVDWAEPGKFGDL
jgi:hypothetical protein